MPARALPLLVLMPLAFTSATPARAVTQSASVNANVVKPLTLTALQSLDLGTIILTPGIWSGATAGVSRNGVVSCSPKLICGGAPQVARFKVTGSNRMVVLITAPDVTLVNQANAAQTVKLVLDKPTSVTLTSSGEPGNTFAIGGTVSLNSTINGGVYRGTLNVTVNYQ